MLDCIFNRFIPETADELLIVRPDGKTFVNGLAQTFDASYPNDHELLTKNLTQKEYQMILETINDTLYTYFPCPLCQCFGYCLCPCTLGLSFLIPYSCVRDASIECNKAIQVINQKKFHSKNMHLELKIQRQTSWLEIHFNCEKKSFQQIKESSKAKNIKNNLEQRITLINNSNHASEDFTGSHKLEIKIDKNHKYSQINQEPDDV
eukprot:403340592